MTDFTIVGTEEESQQIVVTSPSDTTIAFESVDNTSIQVTTSFLPLNIQKDLEAAPVILEQPNSVIEIIKEPVEAMVIETGILIQNVADSYPGISDDADNRLTLGSDNKLYVSPPTFETVNW